MTNDQQADQPRQTRDRNLSGIIARIRDDGPALPGLAQGGEAREAGPMAPPPAADVGVAPLVWDAAPPPPRGPHLGPRSATPADRGPQDSPPTPEGHSQPPAAGPVPRRGVWYLSSALLAAALMSAGAVAVLYRTPPREEPPLPAAGTDDLALRAELAALQGTIATLSERVESLTTVDEVRRTLDLGERLDRVSQQVAELAGNEDIPGGLDRRLDELAQGLGTVATRVERLAATSERPKDSSLADSGGSGTGAEASRPGTPMALAGSTANGREATGSEETGTEPARVQVTAPSRVADGQPSREVPAVAEPLGETLESIAQSDSSGEVPTGAVPDGAPSGGASPDGVAVGSQSAEADAPEDNRDRSQAPRPQEDGAVPATPADGAIQAESPLFAAQAASPDSLGEEWVVNLIAVRRESTAVDLQRTFRAKGVITEMLELSSGLFGLRVGGFGSRADAAVAATAIGTDLGIGDAYVSRR